MKRIYLKRALAVSLVVACLLAAAGCRTKIGTILANPERYMNKHVIVVGEVTKKLPIPFFDTAGYKLKDDSGEIWVLTRRAYLPEVGQHLKVSGVIECGIRVGPREFGTVLSEQTKESEKAK